MRVQVYEPAIWSDASLGCSSLAGMVDQVAAPGFRVMIQAGGYALDYRVDEARNRVLLCEVIALEPPKP